MGLTPLLIWIETAMLRLLIPRVHREGGCNEWCLTYHARGCVEIAPQFEILMVERISELLSTAGAGPQTASPIALY